MENLKLLINSLLKAVNLTPHKQIVLVCFLVIGGMSAMGYKLYQKNENQIYQEKIELNEYKVLLKQKEIVIDSLYNELALSKIDNLTERVHIQDSLLRESQNIQRSIKPLVKQINKKINEVHR